MRRKGSVKKNEEKKGGEDLLDNEEPEASLQMQPLFKEDPIIAYPDKAEPQPKQLIEEIFRSQIKLISDTVAKEFFFILEFFDF